MSSNIFPSANSWITPRSIDGQITTDNAIILFNQKIEKVNKVYINLPNSDFSFIIRGVARKAKLSNIFLDENHTIPLDKLDITYFVVNEEEYATLKNYTQADYKFWYKCQNNTWYYNKEGIYLPNDRIRGVIIKTVTPLENIINATLYQLLYKYGKKDGKLYLYYGLNNPDNVEFSWADGLTSIGIDTTTMPNIINLQFRIYYTPLGESVKLQVPKTNPQVNQFCIPYSQQQPIVDNVTLGREMQSVANRAGCEKKEVVRTCHSIKEIRRPRDGWYCKEKDANGNLTGNIWRLTSAHYTIYSETYIVVKETWSKNWSYRSENVPINREFRSWKIPADIVQRNLLWQDYCLITRKDVTIPNEDPEYPLLLSKTAKTELMRGLDGSCSGKYTECNNMWFYTYDQYGEIPGEGGVKKGAVLSCSSFGFGNSLVFTGKTKDNLSAGVQRVKSDDKDGNYQFCKDVYYCKEDGKMDYMYIQVGSAMYSGTREASNLDASYLYPEYRDPTNLAAEKRYNAPDIVNGIALFGQTPENGFKILKDPCEQLNFTYQLHLLTDDGFLVIGSTWAATNPLVKQRDKAQTIKVWKLTQPIPQGAQVMTATYGTEQQSNLFAVDASSGDPTITFNPQGTVNNGVGVCVTDEHNAVLIAFNSSEPATFHVKFTHNYTAIAKAIKH